MTDVGAKVIYHEYISATDSYVKWGATVRVVPGGENVNVRHSKRHLTVRREDVPAGFVNVNNVENIENWEQNDHWGNNFWTHRWGHEEG